LNLGKGELQAIAYCKKEKVILATNDIKARKVAKTEGVSVISLQAILKAIWKKGIRNKKEVKEFLSNYIFIYKIVFRKIMRLPVSDYMLMLQIHQHVRCTQS